MKVPWVLLFFAVAYTSAFIFVWLICSMMAATQAPDIFNRYLCEHKSLINAHNRQHRNLIRVIAFISSPLAPALLLGNVATYDERKASLIRELQADIMQDVEEKIKQETEASKKMLEETSLEKIKQETEASKKKLVETFREIQRNIYDGMKHARLYSYYRVVHGVLSSTSFILTVFLIKVVSPIVSLQLYEGIVTKFRALLEISPTTKPEIMKWLFLSVTTFLVFYSLAMIVTALSRYVYHSKGQNMTIKGQISLGIYFFFHVVTWCTVWLALFSTAGLAINLLFLYALKNH